MRKVGIVTKCPAYCITHGFLGFEDSDQNDNYIRSANMQKVQMNKRSINISRVMVSVETFHHKRMGFIKFILYNKNKILLV